MTPIHCIALATRRTFLTSLSARSTAALIPARGASGSAMATAGRQEMRGLAPAADYLFDPGLVYLNTGSLGPTPVPVLDRTVAAWKELERNPVFHGYSRATRAMDEVRAKAAAFINCRTEELVLTRCTTDGLNWVAQGLAWSAGDRVLTTDQEHPGGRVCWDYVARRHGADIDTVEFPRARTTARPSSTDSPPRLARARACSRLRTCSVLRVAHAGRRAVGLGAIARMHCGRGRRAGRGRHRRRCEGPRLPCVRHKRPQVAARPEGNGMALSERGAGTTIDPIALQSGRASYSDSSGVGNIPGVLGLGAAIDYISAIGKARIEAYNMALRNRLHAALQEIPQLRVVSAAPGPLASPLLTFALPDRITSGALYQRLLDKHKAVVKVVPGQWLNGNRISTHLFNTERDVDALVTALKTELA